MPPEASAVGPLSVVIPAYNESARIGATLRTLVTYLQDWPVPAEIIVVDDGSTDKTVELARRILADTALPHRVLTGRTNRGKGYTVREGALAARYAWTLLTDADLSTPVDNVEKLFVVARQNDLDIVAGSRGLSASRIGVAQNWLRRNMGRTFNHIVRLLTHLPLKDTQCGFKLWQSTKLQPIFAGLRIDGFAWDVEMLMAARRAGLSMQEVPVEWNNAPGSKVAIVSDSLRMLWDVVRLRLGR